MHQQQRTNMLQIATRKQSISSPAEYQQYCSRNVEINNSKRFHRETNEYNIIHDEKTSDTCFIENTTQDCSRGFALHSFFPSKRVQKHSNPMLQSYDKNNGYEKSHIPFTYINEAKRTPFLTFFLSREHLITFFNVNFTIYHQEVFKRF